MPDPLSLAENERRFLAQELHDSMTQSLLQVNMQASICKQYLAMGLHAELKKELDALERQINTVSHQLRQLTGDLRPPVSSDGSFNAILKQQIETHLQRGGPPVNQIRTDKIILSGPKRLALARISQEALKNIRKHAQATQVDITLTSKEGQCQLIISDNGIGFDDALVPNPLSEKGGAGMINMCSRANLVGGKFDIHAQPEQGTSIKVTIPL
ncbi:MAG TPA: sensor histidine kinase [Anaerolineae bacterium]|nr:sensor histidine kinase [Anaerolineae bacterium]